NHLGLRVGIPLRQGVNAIGVSPRIPQHATTVALTGVKCAVSPEATAVGFDNQLLELALLSNRWRERAFVAQFCLVRHTFAGPDLIRVVIRGHKETRIR